MQLSEQKGTHTYFARVPILRLALDVADADTLVCVALSCFQAKVFHHVTGLFRKARTNYNNS